MTEYLQEAFGEPGKAETLTITEEDGEKVATCTCESSEASYCVLEVAADMKQMLAQKFIYSEYSENSDKKFEAPVSDPIGCASDETEGVPTTSAVVACYSYTPVEEAPVENWKKYDSEVIVLKTMP